MKYNLYVGGYGTESIARVALRDGRMRVYETFPAVNASYLCLSPDGRRLYAVGETKRFRGEEGGSVQSYDILPGGGLTQTSMQPTHGVDPCHLSLAGDLLIASNYGSGSLSRYRLEEDGRIGVMLPLVRHEGSGPRSDRQAGPHVHQAQLTPSGWLAVSDLGLDSVFFYSAPEIAQDRPAAVRVRVPAGFGPRHCAFPRGMDVWYVLCELQSELLIYRGAPESAALIGRVPVGDGRTPNAPAALRLSPDQKLLAATGRGQNVIALFAIRENGMLAQLTEVSSRGDWPRDVQFTPDGKYLVCANQKDDSLTAFAVADGRLEYCGSVRVASPACVLFAPRTAEFDGTQP